MNARQRARFATARTHFPTKCFSTILLAAFLTIQSTSPAADSSTGPTEWNPAEKWVVEQVTAGQPADLIENFPEEENRKLRARFLEDLLTSMLPGVKPHRNGVRIYGAIIDEPINLGNAQIPWEAWLEYCQFRSSAILRRATFERAVSFNNSTFAAEANFYGIKVGQSIFCRNTVFEGPVDFLAAEIASSFEATEAKFRKKANFNNMKIGNSAFFSKAVFDGPADFGTTDIGTNFEADEAHSNNKEQKTNFNRMKVGNSAFFGKAVFEGPADFLADIGSNFEAQKAQFRNKTEIVWLDMKCEGKGLFTEVSFAGPVSFADSSFLSLIVKGAKPGTGSVPRMDFSRCSIKRQLSIREIRIRDLLAGSLHVEGPAGFMDIIVEHSADLSDGDFGTLDLSSSIWPKDGHDGQTFQLRGMNYKYLRADPKESKSHDALLKLMDQSAFSADVYGNLEAFFLRQGHRAYADKAFIAGKRRERKEHLSGIQYFGSLVLDLLVGYGRHAWQIGIPCAFLVGFGIALFSPNKMEPQKIETTFRIYNRFWYSLGLFLPIVNLESDKVWKPKPEQTFLRNYMRVHILLGWILIPILVAALTGLIK